MVHDGACKFLVIHAKMKNKVLRLVGVGHLELWEIMFRWGEVQKRSRHTAR